jgi:hypothetical protein
MALSASSDCSQKYSVSTGSVTVIVTGYRSIERCTSERYGEQPRTCELTFEALHSQCLLISTLPLCYRLGK